MSTFFKPSARFRRMNPIPSPRWLTQLMDCDVRSQSLSLGVFRDSAREDRGHENADPTTRAAYAIGVER
jgi:hypothetical protein